METRIKKKILLLEDLIKKVNAIKNTKKVVVQTHGVFDIIHPGLIKHLNSARGQGDVLIATVIKDKDVRRGPGRPIFPEDLRAENVASLAQVDYVSLVDDEAPFECVKRIKPDIFAKGQAYKDRDGDINRKIFEKEKELYFGKSKIYETDGFLISAQEVIKNFIYIYPKEVESFLKGFSKKYTFKNILEKINSLQRLKVLLVGDGIIDEYHYCESIGKAAKAPIIVNKYLTHEVFTGGAFAIANHIAGLCNDVQLVSLLGKENSREEFIKDSIKPNIKTKFFYREDAPTIVKKRYINQYQNQKLFEVNYLNDNYIDEKKESEIIKYLVSTMPSYDIVLVTDYGHGFLTDKIIKVIEKSAKRFAVNTQMNAANAGYNMIVKYRSPHYVCLDEMEIRWAAQERFADIKDVTGNILRAINADCIIVTLGKKGSFGINKNNVVNRTPVFSSKVVDTVGAGDAFFAFTAPCVAKGMPLDLVSFIGNAVGALAVQIVCNKKAVEKFELLEFIHNLFK